MRYLFIAILVFVCCVLQQAETRPSDSQENDSEMEDEDYERNDANEAEDSRSDDEAPLSDQSSMVGDQEENVQQRRGDRNEYFVQNRQPPAETREARRNSYDTFPEYKLDNKKLETRDEETEMKNEDHSNCRRADRYLEHNPDDHLVSNPDGQSGFEENAMQNDAPRNTANSRRMSDSQPDDSSDLIFENTDYRREQLNKVQKNDRNAEFAEQTKFNKKYYNSFRTENEELERNQNYETRSGDSNRDRREAEGSNADDAGAEDKGNEKRSFDQIENEDDQAAIKRHIKKLSTSELDDLLNSLSADKRVLLQTIIDSDNDFPKKREITKKAGAVEENNYLDGGQDSNKVPGPVLNMNTDLPVSQNSDSTDSSKTTGNSGDNGDISGSTKNIESNVVSYCPEKMSTSANDNAGVDKLSNADSVAPPAESATSKTGNKREVDMSTFNNDEFNNDFNSNAPSDESYVFSQDEDLSQLIDDEAQLHYENRNTQKRGTSQENNPDFSDSIKSLQESFPNSNAYDDLGPYSGSDMAPLIRMKRRNKNHAVKKRGAAILPESQVAYVPYRAENEDEDNDEGNEFYDDGFFDRTASFAKNNVNKLSESRRKIMKPNTKRNANGANSANFINNGNGDTMNIGSDTDSVLSGVEGVDENLMYNGGARKKRSAEKGRLEPADDLIKEDLLTCPPRSMTTVDDLNKKPDSFSDVMNYAGNEAFGPLPRSYDGELSRYKRIRRLKQPLLQATDTEEHSSTDTSAE